MEFGALIWAAGLTAADDGAAADAAGSTGFTLPNEEAVRIPLPLPVAFVLPAAGAGEFAPFVDAPEDLPPPDGVEGAMLSAKAAAALAASAISQCYAARVLARLFALLPCRALRFLRFFALSLAPLPQRRLLLAGRSPFATRG